MSADTGDVCPRCGGGFHCGANDPAPCACATLKFDEATLAELRRRYAGCLCLSCLRHLAPSTTAAAS
jgi:Cysteine-rich CWC